MKKTIILLIYIIILTNMACFANDKASLISDMGILKMWDTTDFKGERYVTKDEFLSLLTSAVKMQKQSFSLVYPHDYIEPTEALDMVIHAIDYEPMAEARGALAVAASYRLTAGVDMQGNLTRKSAVNLIYNMLSSDLMIRDSYQADNISYSRTDKNLFERLWEVKKIRGTVTAVNDASVTIDGKNYILGYKKAYEHLFMQVDCYYTAEEGRVVYLQPAETAELLIKSYDVLSSGSNFIEFENNDRVQRISYKEIIKNDSKISYTDGIFKTPSTHIKAVSSQNNSVYDMVFVYEYETYLVDYTENDVIYPVFKDGANPLGTARIDADPTKIRIYNQNNEQIEADDLTLNDVIEVSGNTIRVVTGTAVGIVDEMTDKGIYIEGNFYEYADDRSFQGLFNIGDELIIYTDIDNRIAAYKKSASMLYGYLADYIYEKTAEGNLMLKIFNEKGELNLHYAAETMRINGQRQSSDVEAVEKLEKNQMIAYRENKKREITAIYTATDNKNDYLTRNDNRPSAGYTSFQFVGENSTLVSDKKRFSLGSDTRVLFTSSRNKGGYNEDLRYPDSFSLHNWWEFNEWSNYNVKIYEATDMQRAKIVLVSSPVFNESGRYTLMVVDKVSVVENDGGTQINRVYGYVGGKYAFRDIKTGVNFSIKNGDVIEVRLNGKNEIIEKPNLLYSVGDVISEKQCMTVNGYAVGIVTECDRSGVVISDVYYPLSGEAAYYGYTDKVPKSIGEIRRNQKVILYMYESRVTAVVVIE